MPADGRHLYVFIDEGGNLDFSPTGTRYFTLTTVAAFRPFAWDEPLNSLKYDLIEQGIGLDRFHAAEDRQAVRDKVFAIIAASLTDVRLDSLIVEKRKTHPKVQTAERFYPEMLGYLLKYVLQPGNLAGCSEVVVVTDSLPLNSKRKAIEKAVKMTLVAMIPAGTPYRVHHIPSRSLVALQVADYCNWAVFKKWERVDTRSYEVIKAALHSEFDICQKGTHYFY